MLPAEPAAMFVLVASPPLLPTCRKGVEFERSLAAAVDAARCDLAHGTVDGDVRVGRLAVYVAVGRLPSSADLSQGGRFERSLVAAVDTARVRRPSP